MRMVRTASWWPIGRLTAGRDIAYSVEAAAGGTFVPLARLMCATFEIDGYSVIITFINENSIVVVDFSITWH